MYYLVNCKHLTKDNYKGTIKKNDTIGRMCDICFENNKNLGQILIKEEEDNYMKILKGYCKCMPDTFSMCEYCKYKHDDGW